MSSSAALSGLTLIRSRRASIRMTYRAICNLCRARQRGLSTPAAVSGYPNITVPGGYVRGLPVGVSFFGRAWSEPVLLRVAHAYEQATRHRQPPRLPASLELGKVS